MKKTETSKKILLYCEIIVAAAVVVTFIAAFCGVDVTAVAEVDVALVGLAAAAHSFYYWKAKAENMKKYHQEDRITMGEEDRP